MSYFRALTSFDLRPAIPTDNPFDVLNEIAEPEDTRTRYSRDDLKALQASAPKPTPEQQKAIDRVNQAIAESRAFSAQARAASHKNRHYAQGHKRHYSYHHPQSHGPKHQKIEQWFRNRQEYFSKRK